MPPSRTVRASASCWPTRAPSAGSREDLQLVATAAPAAIEEIESEPVNKLTILGLDGTVYIEGDTHGLWTFIYDVYGNLWYERPAVNNWISLPGQRVYIVKVGDTVRKLFLN